MQPASSVLIFGALAIDTLAQQAAAPNASANNVKISELTEAFGGCAGNVAYGLALQGTDAIPCAVIGDDFYPKYAKHFHTHGISERGLFSGTGLSARAIIFTDADRQTQTTAFYPGPQTPPTLAQDVQTLVTELAPTTTVIAPIDPSLSRRYATLTLASPLRLWCPGQYTAWFDAAAVDHLLRWCQCLVVNATEWPIIRQLAPDAAHKCTVIITRGADPVLVLNGDEKHPVSVPAVRNIEDPTGCGDAFVAGLVHHLTDARTRANTQAQVQPVNGYTDAIANGIKMAARCLVRQGAQTY